MKSHRPRQRVTANIVAIMCETIFIVRFIAKTGRQEKRYYGILMNHVSEDHITWSEVGLGLDLLQRIINLCQYLDCSISSHSLTVNLISQTKDLLIS